MLPPPVSAPVRRRISGGGSALLVLGLALLLSPASVSGQRMGPEMADASTPFTVGVRGGWEFTNSDWILGAHARIGVPGAPFLDLQVVGDLTFASPPGFLGGPSFTERSLAADVLFRSGTLAVGGGPVFRNSYWVDLDSPRETRTGWSAVGVLGGVADPRSAVTFQLEYRYTRIEGFGLQALSLGLGVVPTRLF